MKLGLNNNAKYNLAKSFTELAIQNGLFTRYEDPVDTAKDIALFFDTIACSIDSDSQEQ